MERLSRFFSATYRQLPDSAALIGTIQQHYDSIPLIFTVFLSHHFIRIDVHKKEFCRNDIEFADCLHGPGAGGFAFLAGSLYALDEPAQRPAAVCWPAGSFQRNVFSGPGIADEDLDCGEGEENINHENNNH